MGFLYLTKEAGQPTLPRNDGPRGDSVAEQVLARHPEQAAVDWPDGFVAGVAHRLDHWTSGLVIAATSLESLAEARTRFGSHTLRKQYRFLTDRSVPWETGAVEHDLAHDRKDRRKMVWRRGRSTPHRGKWYPAYTELRRLRAGSPSLWGAVITTGVTHQVRLHAASAGLALLGDRLYGGTPVPEGRYFLHHAGVDGWPGAPTVPLPGDWPTDPTDKGSA